MESEKSQDRGFKRVLSRFQNSLSDKLKTEFQCVDAEDVYDATDDIQMQQAKTGTLLNLRRLKPFLDAIEQFGQILEIFTNSSEYISFILGPLKFLLLTAVTWTEALDSLLEAYSNIAENLPQFKRYKDLFGVSSYTRKILEMIYEDILDFHKWALKFFMLKNWKMLFHALWNNFGHRFKFLTINLKRNKNLVESCNHALEYEHAKELRLSAEATFTQFEEDERRSQFRKVTKWLSPANFKIDQETASNHREGNKGYGRWLFMDENFSALCDPQSTMVQSLWLNGIPGAGKTVLASIVIEEIRSMPSFSLAFFFCKHKDPSRDNSMALLSGLLVQLLSQHLGLLPYVYDRFTSSGEVVLKSFSILKDLFGIVLRNSARPFIIIDGIDECEQEERKLFLKYLNTLSVEIEGNEPPRILYISRDEGDIRKILSKVSRRTISLQDSEQDIKVYTISRASEIQEKFKISNTLRENIITAVCGRARGMFLYVHLVMINLLDQTTSHELMDELSLGSFPSGLVQAYGRIATRVLENPNCAEQNEARRILGWILCATRPLKWYEIQGVASIDPARQEVDFERLCIRISIKDLCGSLVHIDDQDNIELVHSTARHYLLQEWDFVEIDEHRNLAFIALQYLVLDCFKSTLTDSELRKYVVEGYFSFMDYAFQNWLKHVELSASTTGLLLERLIGLIEDFIRCHWIDSGPVPVSTNEAPRYLGAFSGTEIHDKLSRIEQSERLMSSKSTILDLDSILSRTRQMIEQIAIKESDRDQGSSLQKFYGPNFFKCTKKGCRYFHEGFPLPNARDYHVQMHNCPYFCPHAECTFGDLGFRTLKELKAHTANTHGDDDFEQSSFTVEKIEALAKDRRPEGYNTDEGDSEVESLSDDPARSRDPNRERVIRFMIEAAAFAKFRENFRLWFSQITGNRRIQRADLTAYAILRDLLRPKLLEGYKRITWTCGCGKHMFADVKELLPGGSERLQAALRQSAAKAAAHTSSSQAGPAAPQPAHLPSSGQQSSVTGHQTARSHHLGSPISASHPSAAAAPLAQPPVSKYLLLCVNTKRSRALEHVEVTSLKNDEYLFQAIRQAYENIRHAQTWSPIQTWVPIPKRLITWVGGVGFSIPKSANSVKFHLVPVKMDVCPAYLQHPSIPPVEEVLQKKNYHYSPCPMDIEETLLSNQFIHELLTAGPHLDRYWIDSIPKKLNDKLLYNSGCRPFGWGVHIVEGPNWLALSLFALGFVTLSGILAVVYSALTKDVSSGFAVGAYVVTVLTLAATLQYLKFEQG